MKVIFSHGKESGPTGAKSRRLAEVAGDHGFRTDSIDYTDTADPGHRVDRLVGILQEEDEGIVLVGSSMGGYVSLVASGQVPVKAIFLLAPALYMPGYAQQSYPMTAKTEIVHGWSDDVIPPEHSIRYAKASDCTLHLISGDHRLTESLDIVADLFARFLKTL